MNKIKYSFLFVILFAITTQGQEKKVIETKTPENWTAQEVRIIDRPDEIVAVLENGMVAIVRENRTAPVAAVRLYVKAGSIYEGDNLGAGLSHLFEHLLAGGATQKRSEEDSKQLIQKIGARFNAYTSKERTCYYLTVPAQHVGSALDLVADWVTRPTFPEDSFKREWGVVQRELEMGATDPQRQLWKLFSELRYKVHPAGYPVIGHQAIVQKLTRQNVLDYYHRMYVPDHCVIVITGDINAEKMLEAIKKEFKDFARTAKPTIVLPEEPDITAPREMVNVFPALKGPAKMILGFPSFKLQHPDVYALDTLANIMGQGKSSRLYQVLREKEQLVLGVMAANDTPYWAEGTFLVICEMDPANVAGVQTAITREIENIVKKGVTDTELARARRQLLGSHIRSHQTSEQQAASMAEDYLATGDPHYSDHYTQNMQKVTAKQVQEMARKYLLPQKQISVVITPTPLPGLTEDKQAKQGESEVKKITLKNGLRVLLKRNPAVPLVNMQLFTMGGFLDETDANSGLTNLLSRLSVKGTKNYTAKQIIDYFDGVGGLLNASSGNNTYYYAAEVMSQDFKDAFNIFSDIVLNPTFPQGELAKLKPQILAGIEKVKNSWPAEGERFFREKFFTNSPYQRFSMGTTDTVKAISREKIADFHRANTVGARSVLAIFGDLDMVATENLVREKFETMPAGSPFDLSRFPKEPEHKALRVFVEKTDKNGATVHVGYPGIKLTDIQERYAMEVVTEIVGSYSGWLFTLLRGKQLVYYTHGSNFIALLPGYVVGTAQCEAEKAPEVMRLIMEQLARPARGEFTEDQVAQAKSKLINSEILDKLTSSEMATSAALDEMYFKDYKWSRGNANRIMAITLDDAKKVAAKYLASPATVTIKTSRPELFKKPAPIAGGVK
ncbi:MAG: insulinase family protein [Phycisphaerae bacterium]|nr:insulinase family protein [Phycisphaerae bacterium]